MRFCDLICIAEADDIRETIGSCRNISPQGFMGLCVFFILEIPRIRLNNKNGPTKKLLKRD